MSPHEDINPANILVCDGAAGFDRLGSGDGAQHLTFDLLIEAADEQLYQAKRNGRNQVMGPALELHRRVVGVAPTW